jgi:hypothetical protein
LASIGPDSFQQLTGLRLEAEGGSLREDLPPIQRWLNRLLALRIALQNDIFEEYSGLIETRVAAAREAGTLDLGVETVPVDAFEIVEDRIVRTDARSGATTHLLRVELARRPRPMRYERLDALRAPRTDAVPMLNGRSGKAALRVNARSLMSEEGLPIARFELIRPLKREFFQRDQLGETSWERVSRERFEQAWRREAEEAAGLVRREALHLATGLLLPVWDKLPEDHLQVVRIAAENGRSLLGREIPAIHLSELGAKLGLDIALDMPPDELAGAVLRTGRPLPINGLEALTLKRSLVNGSQRLELAGFSAARLAWYKAQGCFTEIIRYQTRLFVPVDQASVVLERIGRR